MEKNESQIFQNPENPRGGDYITFQNPEYRNKDKNDDEILLNNAMTRVMNNLPA